MAVCCALGFFVALALGFFVALEAFVFLGLRTTAGLAGFLGGMGGRQKIFKDLCYEPSMTAVLSIDVGKKNLAMCCLQPGADPHGREDTIVHWVVTSTLPACHSLVDTLRTAGVLDWLPSVKDVVIERQPGKNTPMVRLQCYLEMFFALHDKHVALADPRNKLSFAAASPYWPGKVPDNWSYYTRKKMAVESMKNFLRMVPQPDGIREAFEKSTKRDDYADAALQGMAHAHFVAPLENARAQAKRSKVPMPRRPSERQLASGKLAKSHAVALVLDRPGALDSLGALQAACDEYKPLRRALVRHFGSAEFAYAVLSEWAPQHEAAKAEAKAAKRRSRADLGPPAGPPPPLPPGPADAHADEEAGMPLER